MLALACTCTSSRVPPSPPVHTCCSHAPTVPDTPLYPCPLLDTHASDATPSARSPPTPPLRLVITSAQTPLLQAAVSAAGAHPPFFPRAPRNQFCLVLRRPQHIQISKRPAYSGRHGCVNALLFNLDRARRGPCAVARQTAQRSCKVGFDNSVEDSVAAGAGAVHASRGACVVGAVLCAISQANEVSSSVGLIRSSETACYCNSLLQRSTFDSGL